MKIKELNMNSEDLKNILENASSYDEPKTSHILSNISYEEVLLLSDESNSLKIKTLDNDVLSLSSNEWTKASSNDTDGFATYSSIVDESVRLFVDETKVEVI